jgi:hypothetical protein
MMDSEEKKGRQSFEGYKIPEDTEVEAALEEYKSKDAQLWQLTMKYLYPPEEVPYEGKRELVFPNVAAREDYATAKRLAHEAQERYERIAQERQSRESSPS